MSDHHERSEDELDQRAATGLSLPGHVLPKGCAFIVVLRPSREDQEDHIALRMRTSGLCATRIVETFGALVDRAGAGRIHEVDEPRKAGRA